MRERFGLTKKQAFREVDIGLRELDDHYLLLYPVALPIAETSG